MKIISYKNGANIVVEFQDEYKYTTPSHYLNFSRGSISNPYSKSVYGVGYVGIGKHPTHIDQKNTDAYGTWKNMLLRCYHEKERDKHLAYADCTVAEIWHNYQNFADWYEENFYDIVEGRMHIDKDILVKGNKEYAPDKCIFVPQRINMIFMKKNRTVDSDLPTGIHRGIGGYITQYNTKHLGTFQDFDEALNTYMIEKRLHIKNVTEDYGDKLPQKVREALLNW
jgi:hypothetical protein